MFAPAPLERPITFGEVVYQELDPGFSREPGVIAAGSGILKIGQVLGKITAGGTSAVSTAKAGGNTGNGALTLDATTPVLAGAKAGVYSVRAIGNAFDGAIAAAAGNTGNGAAAMHTTETAAGVVAGVYKAVFVEPATDAGRFVVEDPAGVVIGQGVVGTLFDGVVKFTISDGATDFAAGDAFTITVTAVNAANAGSFEVKDPAGAVLGTYAIGGAAFATQLKFAIADGATDFVLGDGFDITVTAADASKFKPHDPAAIDGSQKAVAILGEAVDATSLDQRGLIVARLALLRLPRLIFKTGISAGDKAAALASLAESFLLARDV